MGVYTTIDPVTGDQIAQYPEISDTELDDLIGRSTAAYRAWRTTPLEQRRAVLTRAAEIHREQAEELAKVLTLEMGKPIAQAKGEVALVASIYQFYADHVEEYTADEPLDITGPGTAVVRTEPIGPLVGVMPWNYPYYQVARFAAPNIALGNTIILKHARNCPQSALAIERVLAEAGLPVGVYLNAFISSAQVANTVADSRVQGVSLTGSEKAGSAVGEVAGRHMKKCVLELGGSDPFIVLDDADVEAAAAAAVVGRLGNGGQACTASKRFLVEERVYEEFVQKFVDGMAGWQPGDPTSPETKLGPMASNAGVEELDELVQDAISRGAEALLGGNRPEGAGAYYPPTVLAGVTREMRAFREELFGPVAVVYRVGSMDEAIDLANDSPFGLSSSVFTSDPEKADRVAEELETGMVWINGTSKSSPDLPFGGVKGSGFGRELAKFGFNEFANKKLVRNPKGTK
ncbi:MULTISPECIES: NAD-dependent succinate-semialdehyde dehydrogenase [unclassified Rhodococcus (in: high G+C Gram-positive bacteria)]|uniref:6-oxohexanoate dehydrogenase n=1 Tax=Rhodococcus wratislaviensis TaxID=44752 RepID=K7XBT9_RHOWR|nr:MULTISPECIES: NAD-dependent succinate-semialdehyde dehydrogenase [unclassified Rhodococcus (in: high G+C Gram-positive bacteria)]AFX59907.1 6-oxohexanoate dehydrogenase [Rhodococcus wratislaviensis]ELB93568.1 6-oxohexanoate dehydrogenase [Rhodococcus wratislaviensis IFP 2016]MBC2637443.1 NAD-dependent succinate-semialdehyde dehydrogenase [Rhodococcus sp. 3A]MBC2898173.1 NAD-dependent succinate-semialdehyde dehydrogenase [Rhodococcus sp. 4CII]